MHLLYIQYTQATLLQPSQPEINNIKNNKLDKNIRMYHPWSSLTDGGLNEYIVVGATPGFFE